MYITNIAKIEGDILRPSGNIDHMTVFSNTTKTQIEVAPALKPPLYFPRNLDFNFDENNYNDYNYVLETFVWIYFFMWNFI